MRKQMNIITRARNEYITDINSLSSNIRRIRDYITCSDQHTNINMIFYQIKCVAACVHNDVSMIINKKVDNSIKN